MLPWDAMWRAALRAGVGPGDFWRLSVREWRWLAGAGEASMRGDRLEELMGRFPDARPVDPHLTSPFQGEEQSGFWERSVHTKGTPPPERGRLGGGQEEVRHE